jgi:hypothetical protein
MLIKHFKANVKRFTALNSVVMKEVHADEKI